VAWSGTTAPRTKPDLRIAAASQDRLIQCPTSVNRRKCLNRRQSKTMSRNHLIFPWKNKQSADLPAISTPKQKTSRPTPRSLVRLCHAWTNDTDDGRINVNINSKTESLNRFFPSEEDFTPEKLKLDPLFFPDRDEKNYHNPPEMNIVIQIVGSRGFFPRKAT